MRQNAMVGRFSRTLAVGAALFGVLGGTLAGATSASAAGERCPKGAVCLFSGADGTGTMTVYHSSHSDLGTVGTRARSWANRSSSYVSFFPGAHYSVPKGAKYGLVGSEPADKAGNFAWGDTSYVTGMTGHVGSVRVAPTGHEADTGRQYIAWYAPQLVDSPTPHTFGSFLNNGYSQLLMRSVEGNLWLLGASDAAKNLGGGWNSMTALVRHGDFTGDGREDVIARDAKGNLWVYPGNAQGTLSGRRALGAGWNAMTALVGIGDLTGDGRNDLVARDAKGKLWVYPGNSKGTLSGRRALGAGWNTMTALVGAGDLNSDGRPDLVARDAKGKLWLYPGTSKGVLGVRHLITSGVSQAAKLFAIGDADGDGHNDLYAASAPMLDLFSGNGKGLLPHSKDFWGENFGVDSRELYF